VGNPIPSFTGIASGEKSTVVILATDDPYLIHSPMKPFAAEEMAQDEDEFETLLFGLEMAYSCPHRHKP